jgi:hypothetical protein
MCSELENKQEGQPCQKWQERLAREEAHFAQAMDLCLDLLTDRWEFDNTDWKERCWKKYHDLVRKQFEMIPEVK